MTGRIWDEPTNNMAAFWARQMVDASRPLVAFSKFYTEPPPLTRWQRFTRLFMWRYQWWVLRDWLCQKLGCIE